MIIKERQPSPELSSRLKLSPRDSSSNISRRGKCKFHNTLRMRENNQTKLRRRWKEKLVRVAVA